MSNVLKISRIGVIVAAGVAAALGMGHRAHAQDANLNPELAKRAYVAALQSGATVVVPECKSAEQCYYFGALAATYANYLVCQTYGVSIGAGADKRLVTISCALGNGI